MSGKSTKPEPSKTGRTRPPGELRASEVAAWLRQHPDFLVKHPDLLSVLTPPSRQSGDSVVDMQQFMVERQRREIGRLRQMCQELLAVGRANMSTQSAVHEAVLATLGARSFEHLIDIVTGDFAAKLSVDVVTICVEGRDASLPRAVKAGVYVLEPGAIDAVMGRQVETLLRDDVHDADPAVFGPAASLVRSEALARLNIGPEAPPGLIAIGSREAGFFSPSHSTELLGFLARAVELAIRNWLDLPQKRA